MPNAAPAVAAPEVSAFEATTQNFHRAADRLELADDLRTLLLTSYREVRVAIPMRLADGRIHTYSGYRVQHNADRGPFKGGIRFHTTVDVDEFRALAATMTWKTALGGDEVNGRLERIMRRAYGEVVARAGDEAGAGTTLRVAAHEVAIERVVEAARLRHTI